MFPASSPTGEAGFSSMLAGLLASIISPMLTESPDPIRLRRASSSTPDTLALGFFIGLPMNSPFSGSGILLVDSVGPEMDVLGGVVERLFNAGGVDPDTGLLEFVAASAKGSAEC